MPLQRKRDCQEWHLDKQEVEIIHGGTGDDSGVALGGGRMRYIWNINRAHVLDFQHYWNRDWTMSLMLFQAAASTLKTLKVEVCEQMTCKLEGYVL